MTTHSSVLAWRIPWAEEPGGLQSIRSQQVGHAEGAECTGTHDVNNLGVMGQGCMGKYRS